MAAHFKSDFAAQALTFDHCPSKAASVGGPLGFDFFGYPAHVLAAIRYIAL
jgi:hypothetical protein